MSTVFFLFARICSGCLIEVIIFFYFFFFKNYVNEEGGFVSTCLCPATYIHVHSPGENLTGCNCMLYAHNFNVLISGDRQVIIVTGSL